MTDFSNCIVGFVFEFGKIQNRSMAVEITVNGEKKITVVPHDKSIIDVEVELNLPCVLELNFFGKNNNTDTIVDESGKIISDMYVKIQSISIDGFPCGPKFLHQTLALTTMSGERHVTSYIGFNGVMKIELLEDNVISQFGSMNQ